MITLTTSFGTGTDTTVVRLGEAIFDGHGFTITFGAIRTTGLFQLEGGKIKYLIVDGNSNTLATNQGQVIADYNSSYGALNDVRGQNITVSENGGGLSAGYALSTANTTIFNRCQVNNIEVIEKRFFMIP